LLKEIASALFDGLQSPCPSLIAEWQLKNRQSRGALSADIFWLLKIYVEVKKTNDGVEIKLSQKLIQNVFKARKPIEASQSKTTANNSRLSIDVGEDLVYEIEDLKLDVNNLTLAVNDLIEANLKLTEIIRRQETENIELKSIIHEINAKVGEIQLSGQSARLAAAFTSASTSSPVRPSVTQNSLAKTAIINNQQATNSGVASIAYSTAVSATAVPTASASQRSNSIKRANEQSNSTAPKQNKLKKFDSNDPLASNQSLNNSAAFIEVTGRRRQRKGRDFNKMVGQNTNLPNFTVAEKLFRVYVGRVGLEMNEEDIRDLFAQLKVKVVKIEMLKPKLTWKSFCVTISALDREVIKNKSLWPRGLVVNRMFDAKKKNVDANNAPVINTNKPRSSSITTTLATAGSSNANVINENV